MGASNLNNLERAYQEESERILFGEDLYKNKHLLPSIELLDVEMIKKYERHLLNLENIGSAFTVYIQHLFMEVCNLYDIKDMADLQEPLNEFVQKTVTHQVGKIGNALIQIKKLRTDIEGMQSYLVEGSQYCFIPAMLSTLKTTCDLLICCIYSRKYLNKEFIESVHEIMNFLISSAYEELREAFKTLECFDIINNRLELKNPITVH